MDMTVASTDWQHGLSKQAAEQRLRQLGPNSTDQAETPAWRVLLGKFVAPVPCLL